MHRFVGETPHSSMFNPIEYNYSDLRHAGNWELGLFSFSKASSHRWKPPPSSLVHGPGVAKKAPCFSLLSKTCHIKTGEFPSFDSFAEGIL
jgi:hypothetical protein